MKVTEKDLYNESMICYSCNKQMEIGQSYERIVTNRKSEIIVHTDCIKVEVPKFTR